MSYRILVTEAMSEDGPDWLRANGYEVKYGRGTDEKTLIEDLQDCDGVIPRLAVMSDAVISACPRLKVIARHGSGVDTVDLESCRRHGVRVVNTRGSNSVAVAEHAMLLVLACAKTLNVLQDRYRRQLGQRLMASLRDASGEREVLSNGKGRYVVLECCRDRQQLAAIRRRIQNQAHGLNASAGKVRSRIAVLDRLIARLRKAA